MMSFTSSGKWRFTFLSLNNTFAGTYTVTIHAYDYNSNSSQHGIENFTLKILANNLPKTNEVIPNQSVTARFGLNYTIPANLFSDDDGETLTYDFSITPSTSLITIEPTSLSYMNVSNASTNADARVYNVTLTASDENPGNSNATASFNVTISANSPPNVNETLSDELFVAERPLTFTHTEYAFKEPDGEAIFLNGSFSPPAPFLTYDNVTRTISGTPSSTDVGIFEFTLTGYDGHSDTGNNTQTVSISIIIFRWTLRLKKVSHQLQPKWFQMWLCLVFMI